MYPGLGTQATLTLTLTLTQFRERRMKNTAISIVTTCGQSFFKIPKYYTLNLLFIFR